ncbi:MAG: hypothetical protein RL667_1052, partial [Pseudomonadota bacterium]
LQYRIDRAEGFHPEVLSAFFHQLFNIIPGAAWLECQHPENGKFTFTAFRLFVKTVLKTVACP